MSMSTASAAPLSTARTLAELVADVARQDGERTAVIFQDRPISYAALDGLIERGANALAARGVRHGDRVAVMLPNIPHFIVAYYAILRLGAVVVPLNVLYKNDEIGYILGDSEAKIFIVYESFYAQAAAAITRSPSVQETIVAGAGPVPAGTTPWGLNPPLIAGAADAPQREPVEVKPEDLAVICYTSGTTGRSKGAMLTHRNFIANCEQIERMERVKFGSDDVLLLVLPLFHIYAMNVGLNSCLRSGGSFVLVTRFEAEPVLAEIQKHHCTIFLGAPPMFVAWVNSGALDAYDLSSLRVVNSGAAALPIQVLEHFREQCGIEIQEGYGLTETAPTTHSNSAGPRIKPGTVGPTIPGVEARVVDENDNDVPLGQEGEIVVRGDNVTSGYWRMPEATAEALRGGWFHTGDVATIDEDGYYTIVDRKKDMINAAGFKVWPREVEEVLFRHPAVREAAVVALPDPYAGERPVAYIALKAGQTATPEELIAYTKQHLASFKAPVHIEFRDDLPKLPTGKVLRRQLRDEARRDFSDQPSTVG
ncbi:MAG: long-chain fatty acid--CoA ligase [Chloroflexota bacterium]|nr:long-chain fatty acid--CoA ligase [Chloroflexota bacterium]